mmetsp:Transcript_144696/g.463650  ORF Transcript_144696/g.463650 Transcript_144696/m.463650 type:complete len:348 (+) Transcript_144696:4352-5395(+)
MGRTTATPARYNAKRSSFGEQILHARMARGTAWISASLLATQPTSLGRRATVRLHSAIREKSSRMGRLALISAPRATGRLPWLSAPTAVCSRQHTRARRFRHTRAGLRAGCQAFPQRMVLPVPAQGMANSAWCSVSRTIEGSRICDAGMVHGTAPVWTCACGVACRRSCPTATPSTHVRMSSVPGVPSGVAMALGPATSPASSVGPTASGSWAPSASTCAAAPHRGLRTAASSATAAARRRIAARRSATRASAQRAPWSVSTTSMVSCPGRRRRRWPTGANCATLCPAVSRQRCLVCWCTAATSSLTEVLVRPSPARRASRRRVPTPARTAAARRYPRAWQMPSRAW